MRASLEMRCLAKFSCFLASIMIASRESSLSAPSANCKFVNEKVGRLMQSTWSHRTRGDYKRESSKTGDLKKETWKRPQARWKRRKKKMKKIRGRRRSSSPESLDQDLQRNHKCVALVARKFAVLIKENYWFAFTAGAACLMLWWSSYLITWWSSYNQENDHHMIIKWFRKWLRKLRFYWFTFTAGTGCFILRLMILIFDNMMIVIWSSNDHHMIKKMIIIWSPNDRQMIIKMKI